MKLFSIIISMVFVCGGLGVGCAVETGGREEPDAGSDGDGGNQCQDLCASGTAECQDEGFRSCEDADGDGCFEWSAVSACTEKEACQAGACVAICVDECAQGERRCQDGASQACGEFDDDPCLEWSESSACDRTEACQAGVCESICNDDCLEGDKRCEADNTERCDDFDDDPCFEWGDSTACGYGLSCDEGDCVDVCSDACSLDELRCDVDASYQVCGNHDQDECLEWSTAEACALDLICVDGLCVCDHECVNGQRRCDPDGSAAHQTCGDPDADGCREWESLIVCEAGERCRNGRCEPDCDHECSDGQVRCVGGGVDAIQTCGEYDADPCRDWSAPLDCEDGLVCNPVSNACRQPYPEGPYGTQFGDTIANLCFESGACGQAGTIICLDEFIGKPATLIAVHTGWCPGCREQTAGAEAMYQTYKPDGFELLQTLYEDDQELGSRAALLSFACDEITDLGLTFAVGIDPGGDTMVPFFDEGYIPMNILIDENMVIQYKVEAYDPATLIPAIELLLGI